MPPKPKVKKPPLTHMICRADLDSRTKFAAAFDEMRDEIRISLGGHLLPPKEHLLERYIFVMWKMTDLEMAMLKARKKAGPRSPGKQAKDAVLNDYISLWGVTERLRKQLGLDTIKDDGESLAARMRELRQEGNA